MYDLVVVGGGPGGSSAAISATRAGARVLLLERGRFPRHKVCGEFISAESLGLLSSLLSEHDAELLQRAVRIAQARLFLDGGKVESRVDPPAASMTRHDLDFALWEAARNAGVETGHQTTVHAIEGEGPFHVSSSAGSFETRSVINSSGRWSNLTASRQRNNSHSEKWLGVKAHFAEPAPAQSADLYFFDGGYCGVQPIEPPEKGEPGRINVCAMVRAEVANTLSEVFAQHTLLRKRSGNWQQLTEAVTTSPLIFRQPQPLDGNVLLAGDAAGFIDPFVGDGISLALRSGTLAARAVAAFLRGKLSLQAAAAAYRSAYSREFLPVFRNAARVRRMFGLPRPLRILLLPVFQNFPALIRYLVRNTR